MGNTPGPLVLSLSLRSGTEPLATDDQEDPTTTTDGAEHHVASRAVRRCRMGRAVRRTAGHRGVRCDGRPGCHAVMGRTGASARRSGLPTGLPALRQPARCRDLTQETFIRVFRSVQNYQPGTFEGWLHRITTNLFLDMVPQARSHPDGGAARRLRPGCRPTETQPDRSTDAHLGADLQAALDSWRQVSCRRGPVRHRGAVLREIGATLGSKLGTVRSHASTAVSRPCATPRRPLGHSQLGIEDFSESA